MPMINSADAFLERMSKLAQQLVETFGECGISEVTVNSKIFSILLQKRLEDPFLTSRNTLNLPSFVTGVDITEFTFNSPYGEIRIVKDE